MAPGVRSGIGHYVRAGVLHPVRESVRIAEVTGLLLVDLDRVRNLAQWSCSAGPAKIRIGRGALDLVLCQTFAGLLGDLLKLISGDAVTLSFRAYVRSCPQ